MHTHARTHGHANRKKARAQPSLQHQLASVHSRLGFGVWGWPVPVVLAAYPLRPASSGTRQGLFDGMLPTIPGGSGGTGNPASTACHASNRSRVERHEQRSKLPLARPEGKEDASEASESTVGAAEASEVPR